MQQVKAVERHTISAALTGSRERRCWPSRCTRWSTRFPWPGICWRATSTGIPEVAKVLQR